MSDLVVVGFKGDKARASAALEELRQLDFRWVIDLERAAAVYRDFDGTLHAVQANELAAREKVALGSLWGALLGAVLTVPFTAGGSAAAAAAIATGALSGTAIGATAGTLNSPEWKADFGIDNAFVRDLGDLITPGDSAIAALLETSEHDAVLERFKGYGGTVLRSTLTPTQAARLQTYLTLKEQQ